MTAPTNWLLQGGNRIGRRLIVLIIAFSSLITLVISAAELVAEYQSLRKGLDRDMNHLEIYLPGLSGSVWDFDEKQIQTSLNALALLPNIDKVVITAVAERKERKWSAGTGEASKFIVRSYPLKYQLGDKELFIGTFEAVASLDPINRQIWARAITIVSGNAVKTLIVAIFMAFLLRRLVTSRLENLARKVDTLAPAAFRTEGADEPHMKESAPRELDEIAVVEWTLEQSTRKLIERSREKERLLTERNEVKRDDAEKRKLLQRIHAAVEEERKHIADELHDHLNASLIVLRLHAEQILNAANRQPSEQLLRDIAEKARMMLKEASELYSLGRGIIKRLRPEVLDTMGLRGAIEEMCEQYERIHPNCRFAFTADIDMGRINANTAITAYRIVQEALSNVIKHSSATACSVDLRTCQNGRTVNMEIRDNGAGFNPVATGDGVGLIAMRERVFSAGGTIELRSAPACGTSILVSLPVSEPSSTNAAA